MGSGRRNGRLHLPESASAANNLDLISHLNAIPDTRMRLGARISAWYLLLVAVPGILSRCQNLRDLEHFAICHHSVLTDALDQELRRPSWIQTFGTSSAKWTWNRFAPRCATGRSPRSLLVQPISTS